MSMNPLTTVALDADAETLLREHGVMVVDGVPMWDFDRNAETVPPSWAVAAIEPCKTCWIPPRSDGSDRTGPCPDCHHGRPVIEVQTACDCACHRLTSAYPGLRHDVLGKCKRDGTCTDGLVSSFWTVGEIAPIVGPNEMRPERAVRIIHKLNGEREAWLIEGNYDPKVTVLTIPGDPADLIGKYALVNCEQVTR